jgi:hypothetical protein
MLTLALLGVVFRYTPFFLFPFSLFLRFIVVFYHTVSFQQQQQSWVYSYKFADQSRSFILINL